MKICFPLISILVLMPVFSVGAQNIDVDSLEADLNKQIMSIQVGHMMQKYGLDSALFLSETALQLALTHVGRLDTTTATLYALVGTFSSEAGMFLKAEKSLRTAIDIHSDIGFPKQTERASIMAALVEVLRKTGRLIEAETLAREALEIRRSLHDANHPDIAYGQVYLAQVLIDRGSLGEAKKLLDHALRTFGESTGMLALNGESYAKAVSASLYLRFGQYDMAEEYYHEILNNNPMRQLTGDDPSVLISLGTVKAYQGHADSAAALTQLAISLLESKPRSGQALGKAYNNLAYQLGVMGKFQEALDVSNRAIEVLDLSNPSVYATLLVCIANNEFNLGNAKQAADHFTQGLAELGKCPGPENRLRSIALLSFAKLKRDEGDWSRALALARDAYYSQAENFNINANFLDEPTALSFSNYMRSAMAGYLSLLFEAPTYDTDVGSDAYDMILKSKGSVSDLVFSRRQANLIQANPALSDIVTQMYVFKQSGLEGTAS